MKRHIWTKLILLLYILSLLTGVAAAGDFANFRNVNDDFDRFQDVSETAWYAESVEQAYEYGLMQGRSQTKFSPGGTLTAAECVALADRLHSIYEKDGATFEQKVKPWYTDYVRYAVEHRILSAQMLREIDYTAQITRGLFARILSRAMPPGPWSRSTTSPTAPSPT